MKDSADSVRRVLMAAMTTLPLTASAAATERRDGRRSGRTSSLVVYFSRSGNTRVVAGLLQRSLGADLFEMQPEVPYPEDYLATVEEARQERDNGRARALARSVPDIARYDTIYLGFPIWGETAPPVIRGFLSSHDLSGKDLIPFITHGGYGLGNSLTLLAQGASRARLQPAFSTEADQERRTMNQVNDWLKSARRKG
ncbi:flavodoxin [Xylophilus sp. GW821-FHT01B05]